MEAVPLVPAFLEGSLRLVHTLTPRLSTPRNSASRSSQAGVQRCTGRGVRGGIISNGENLEMS